MVVTVVQMVEDDAEDDRILGRLLSSLPRLESSDRQVSQVCSSLSFLKYEADQVCSLLIVASSVVRSSALKTQY